MHTIMVIGGGLVLLALFVLLGRQLSGGTLVAFFAGLRSFISAHRAENKLAPCED